MSKCVLLTGGTGFLGSHLLEALIKKNHQVIILKRLNSNLQRINHLAGEFKSYNVEETSIDEIFTFNRIDSVIHTACCYGRNNEKINEIIDVNLVLGVKILDACLKYGINSFINSDTFFNNAKIRQKHLGAYSLSKRHFVDWLMLHSDKIKAVNLVIEHMYGPNDNGSKFIPWLISQFSNNVDCVQLTGGEQKRDFIYVDDVVSAFLLVLDLADQEFQQFNYGVGTGNMLSIRDFVYKAKDIYEQKNGVIASRLEFGILPYGINEIMEIPSDNSGLCSLGWVPKNTIEIGLNKTIP